MRCLKPWAVIWALICWGGAWAPTAGRAEEGGPQLIGHWEFEAIEDGRLPDSSGRGHHGVLVGMGAEALVEGKVGKALRFPGAGAFVRIAGSATAPEFNWNGKSYTLALWTDNAGAEGYLVAQGRGAAQGWGLYGGRFAVGSSAGRPTILNAYLQPEGGGAPFTAGAWHHLAVTYDMASGLLTTYLDGQLSRIYPSPSRYLEDRNDIHREGEDVLFGARATGVEPWYEGRLDDVRMYAQALTGEQIRAIFEGRPVEAAPTAGTGPVATSGPAAGGGPTDAARPRRVVVMGDSTTLSQQSPAGEKLTDRVQFYLDRWLGAGQTTVINSGVGSETAAKGLQRIANVLALQPDVLTVSYGLNDMADSDPEEFHRSLEAIVGAARQQGVGQILLVTSTPFDEARHFFKDWDKFKALGLNRYLEAYYLTATRQVAAGERLPLCDQYSLFMQRWREGRYKITDLIREADGVHLTAEGNDVAGEHLAYWIRQALAGPSPRGEGAEAESVAEH